MNDSNYITPGERQKLIYQLGFRPHLSESMIAARAIDSHAVMDDIARELAEALRRYREFSTLIIGEDALMRYDRVMGGMAPNGH